MGRYGRRFPMKIPILARERLSEPDGVTVYLLERLGNQLFMYAAALAQARRLGTPCYANLGFYRHDRPHRGYPKVYELGVFDNGLVIRDDERYHQPTFLGLPTVPSAQLWHNGIAAHLPTSDVFMERSLAYDPRIEQIERGTTLVGMFQSWRYFAGIEDEIRARMSTLTNPSDWYRSMSAEVVPDRGSILLNLRRGDYVLPEQQRVQGLATREYYARSLAYLRRMGFDGTVYVASDSLDLALTELDGLADFVPIDPPQGTNYFEVLLLLSRADALVAANSTFSWWAGFLGTNADRVVIAPRPWLTQSSVDTRDLLPKNWLTLDRD
jgi:hypothetical protein